MKIKYDYQIFASQKFGGISKYFVYMINELKNTQCKPIVLAPLHINHHLNNQISSKNKFGLFLNTKSRIFKRLIKYFNFFFDFLISVFSNYQIIHLTYFSVISGSYIDKKSKMVITVHDMTYEKFPFLFKNPKKTIEAKKKLIKKADSIIAVSNNTKKDLLKYYNIESKKINVIYHGVDFSIFYKKNYIKNIVHDKKYILYVGNRDGYKNFIKLLEVFSETSLLNNNYNLILFGGEKLSNIEKQLIKKSSIQNKIYQISGNDNLLCKYYNQASVFVSTSLYEGFGMTILESMACECPVIAGNNSSIPEISGGGVCLVDMTKKEDLSYALNKVLYDENYKNKLISLGLNNAKKFNWSITAKKTYDLYKSLI